MADSLQRYKQEKRDEINFRIRLRQACINSMHEPPPCSIYSCGNKRKSLSAPSTPTKSSSPPVTKPKPVIVVSDDDEETMDYEEHNSKLLRQLLKHVALPALDAHATPIPIANPLNHIHDFTPLEQLIRDVAKKQRFLPLKDDDCTAESVRCKYCTGGIANQRYHLISRLVRIERVLFEDGTT